MQPGQFDPVVAAEHLDRILGREGADAVPAVDEQTDDVGEVLLALVVVRRQLAEELLEQGAVERVHPGVDLADLQLFRGRVAVLDDGVDLARAGMPD